MTFLKIPRMNSKMMSQPTSVHSVLNLGLGLNDQMDASQIADAEVADCENFSIEEGTLSTAPGFSLWDDDSTNYGPFWGSVTFTKSTGVALDVRQRQDKLEYALGGGSIWQTCTLPTVGSPAYTISLDQVPCTFAHLNDILLFANGQYVLSSTDGKTWTNQPTLPLCRVVFNNGKNRILFLNQPNSPYRFDWCDINTPLTVNAASYEMVDPNNDGNVIGAGKTPDGTTLIFKEGAVYSVADIVDNGMVDINFLGNITLLTHQTIATTENSVIWIGYAGVFEYISGVIRLISGRINWVGRNDVSITGTCCAAYYNFKYHFSIPDRTLSEYYNCQEYIIYKNLSRNDTVQPYPITRNRRYIGCYNVADYSDPYEGGRDISLMIYDSRSEAQMPTSGSPAVTDIPISAFVNDYRETAYINYGVQDCYFVTKYFNENVAYYVKKYRKLFANMKLFQSTTITLSYRFVPYGQWKDTTVDVLAEMVKFLEGYEFSEGYGFAQDTLGAVFIDINNPEKPRGIQFKFAVSTTKDISYLSLAHNYIVKSTKFK